MGVFAIIIAALPFFHTKRYDFSGMEGTLHLSPFFRKLKSWQNDELACNVQELKLMQNKKMLINK